MSVQDENEARIQHLAEELRTGDLIAYLDELYSPDLVYHGTGELVGAGLDDIKSFMASILAAFPDSRMTFEDLRAEGDQTVARWLHTGTHQGEVFGIPATGRTVSVRGITMSRFKEGRVVEEWERVDVAGLLQQLGAMPAVGAGVAA